MFKGVFTGSLQKAKELNAEEYYWASHKENVFCKKTIEWMILNRFHGGQLEYDCAYDLCNIFGLERVIWVMANTIQLACERMIGEGNVAWAFKFEIPSEDEDPTEEYCVCASGKAIGDLAWQLRVYCLEEEILDYSACDQEATYSDYRDKLLIVAPSIINEMYRTEKYQYFYVEDCERDANTGEACIRGTFLANGCSKTLSDRSVLGIAIEERIPKWAVEKLVEFRKVLRDGNEN